jgi:ATPase family protein associated with various cellular activities (AAA)/winged helix domain-containing protein
VTSSASDIGNGLRFELLDARIRVAVESVAGTDPNPADPFRGLYISDDLALTLSRETPEGDLDARFDEAARLLGLDVLEAAVLGLCAAPELSPHYGRLYAYLHDDVTRKLATPRLVARLLGVEGVKPPDVLGCFDHGRPLRRLGAIRVLDPGGPIPLAERSAKVGDSLAAFLLGSGLDEPARDGRLRRLPLPEYDPGRPESVTELRALLQSETHLPVVVAGPDAIVLVAVALRQPLLVANVVDAEDAELMREAALLGALEGRLLVFDGLEELDPGQRSRTLRALEARDHGVILCAGTRDAAVVLGDTTMLIVEASLPSLAERKEAWSALSGAEDVTDVSAKFRLSIGQIADASEVARLTAHSREETSPSTSDLDLGARQASSTKLAELAARLTPAFGWHDLVLPERQREVLMSISAYLRHRDLVLSEWGYEKTVARNQGLKVLFAGESGTGKTMAGQVLAKELGLELFRIDLATIVSKYIGETEKNLDRIFDAAEGSNAILFFDEADALFGKRSEVRDSHDRYANIEVAYLLQKMEGYAGAVILATNFRQNIDDAFLRRLDVVVDFPFPEAEDRQRIWRLLLPDTAPVAEDIDLDFLASQFKLSGGAIRNCSLSAAFMAADDDGKIGMRHLIRAVALEYGKLGRLTLESDFERFHELIRPAAGNGGAPAAEPQTSA